MALADRRPFGFPVSSTPASPAFEANTLKFGSQLTNAESTDPQNELKSKLKPIVADEKGHISESDIKPLTPEKSLSPDEMSPTLTSISPDSLMAADSYRKLKTDLVASSANSLESVTSRGVSPSFGNLPSKKQKNTSRVPIATGISTTIPVTGEKPRPSQKDDPSLEDDVLYAIFVILFEKDPDGQGMTVKQICDILVEQHPEMANLSTKTSNLVSAKLNAYVKRVEKGDSSLKYALSRDWADASPKRMVYVYRGLLAEDFHVHVKSIVENQKQIQQNVENSPSMNDDESNINEPSKQPDLSKHRRLTMFDLGITKNSFLENSLNKSNLFVPYSSAPVTASLTDTNGMEKKLMLQAQESDLDFEDLEVFRDDEDEDDTDTGLSDNILDLKRMSKRSMSLSYLPLNKRPKVLTAAAAAPKAPKITNTHSPNAAAAAAALHAAALKAISSSSQSLNSSANSSRSISPTNSTSQPNTNWISVIRSGFLNQDIGTPEEISLSDLDKIFK